MVCKLCTFVNVFLYLSFVVHENLLLLIFFFFLIRKLPSSILFPYTTLFRSSLPRPCSRRSGCARAAGCGRQSTAGPQHNARSEEHTSELQSHSDLVCRLLLEKKKLFKTCQRFEIMTLR